MWIVLSLLAAVTSGISVIFQKKGAVGNSICYISSLSTTAIFLTVFVVAMFDGSMRQLRQIPPQCWKLTIASGIVQAASWLTYFLAIQKADVNFLMVLDKFNIVVTMLLAYFFLDEPITTMMLFASVCILLGTVGMADFKGDIRQFFSRKNLWIFWGLLSPTLQAVSNILAKLDTAPISTTTTTTIRMFVVAVVLLVVALLRERSPAVLRQVGLKSIGMTILGGVVMGISYLLMYRAIYLGIAAVVTPIVKANILVTTALSYVFLHEKLSKRGGIGFLLVCVGVALFLV